MRARAGEAAKQGQLRALHRLNKFLLRTGQRSRHGMKAWAQAYMVWVRQIRYTQVAQESTQLALIAGWVRTVSDLGYHNEFFDCLGKRLRLDATNGLLTLFKCFECGCLNLPDPSRKEARCRHNANQRAWLRECRTQRQIPQASIVGPASTSQQLASSDSLNGRLEMNWY